ncbi:hypothetical protein DFH09DRAFT_1275496 [Mycena vulgaris]|nr:hypothetical protein DFH09DRAFT_1275496 [Mycena vulgaris]
MATPRSPPRSMATTTTTRGATPASIAPPATGRARETRTGRNEAESGTAIAAAASPRSRPTTTTTMDAAAGYKGKALRSWPQLPPEVIRLIATYHLVAAAARAPVPASWEFIASGSPASNSVALIAGPHPTGDDAHRGEDTHREETYRRGAGREQRLMYITARDTRELELLMTVCPQWGGALEYHTFWSDAIVLFDPYNSYAHLAWLAVPPPSQHSSAATPEPVRASPFRHFRQLFTYACLPCRVNAPRSAHGLNAGRRTAPAPRLGAIVLCKEHHGARRARWCGVCLKDGELARLVRLEAVRTAQDVLRRAEEALQAARWEGRGERSAGVERAWAAREAAGAALQRAQRAEAAGGGESIVENEDDVTFPGVHAVCRACRAEWLWHCALRAAAPATPNSSPPPNPPLGPGEAEAWARGAELLGALGGTGGGAFAPADPLVRAAVAGFVELGEGTVQHVLVVAGERGWLRAQTRWGELMGQALAARRFNAGGGGGAPAQRDYTGIATVRFVKSADRRRRRSPSVESVDAFEMEEVVGREGKRQRQGQGEYANNAANAAAYARAGYTNTTTTADEYVEDEFEEYDGYSEEEEDDSDLDLDLEEGEDDDAELASALETSVRELALGDWARGRVLDGAWVAPADVYYGIRVNGLDGPDDPVEARHPVPWAVSPPSSPSLDAPAAAEQVHPGARAPPPPTYALAEAAHAAHMRQMRSVLLPPFRNVVRRVIVECALDAEERDGREAPATRRPLDPAVRAARMSLADVVREVREEEGVWFDGVDWRARRRNARADAAREREHEGAREGGEGRMGGEGESRHRGEGSDDSSEGTSRTSDTSPVLSTSTLGTTPSPPPLGEERKDKHAHAHAVGEDDDARQPTIAVMPVMDPPRLLRPIPYVPATIAHLPPYSLEALRAVWREACAPLYHCRCTVCERAMAAAQAAQGGDRAAATTTSTQASKPVAPVVPAKLDNVQPQPQPQGDGPWVVHIPAEDDCGGRGAESVVSLVTQGDEGYYAHTDDSGKLVVQQEGGDTEEGEDEVLSAQEQYWRQVEEDEGPGAWEREMALMDDMATGRVGGGHRREEEEEYSEFEEEEGGGGEYALAPSAWVGGRKRSVDELEGEPGADGDADVDAHAAARGGTPPKRARTGERGLGGDDYDFATVRLVKRRSEELDADDAGSAKRARREGAASPPDSSTPGTVGEGEESPYDTPQSAVRVD